METISNSNGAERATGESEGSPSVDCLTLAYAAREARHSGEWTMKGLATLTDTHGIPGVLAWFADAFAPDRRVLANAFGVALRGAVNVIPPEEESDILRAYATAAAIGIVSKDPAVYAETALLRAAADMRGDTSAEAIVSSARALCDPEDTLPAWLHAFQLAQHLGELNPSAAFAHAFVVETLASLARASVLGAENVPLSDLEANE